jgi:hypothetical protein
MDPSQIPAQASPRDSDVDVDRGTSLASASEDATTCTPAELARRQREVASTRKDLLDAVERLTRKAP